MEIRHLILFVFFSLTFIIDTHCQIVDDSIVENVKKEAVENDVNNEHAKVEAQPKHSTQSPVNSKESPKISSSSTDNKNGSKENGTSDNDLKGTPAWYQKVVENKGMLMRTFYVLIGVTSIVVLYFVVRAWRTRRRHNKSRKYGLITNSGADLEMEPLDQDDDDDEMTMFERRR